LTGFGERNLQFSAWANGDGPLPAGDLRDYVLTGHAGPIPDNLTLQKPYNPERTVEAIKGNGHGSAGRG
jgi:hypothetical protein